MRLCLLLLLAQDKALDLAYTDECHLDMMTPEGEGPFPAVVCVHGGGWHAGSRKSYMPFLGELAKRGYVGVTISYRFAPKHRFPAQIEDVKSAVRWLRANAKRYRINPDKIGAIGDSAGGHLVDLLAVTGKDDGLEGKGNEEQSSRVQAAVALYGPSDLAFGYECSSLQTKMEGGYVRMALSQLLGGTPEKFAGRYRAASPVTYASKDDPPILLVHGTKDTLVGIEQSEILERKLKDAGAGAELLRIEGAGHGFQGDELKKAVDASLKFFDKHLK